MSATIRSLYARLISGDRYALSKAITLVESTRLDHQRQSQELLSLILRPPMTAGAAIAPAPLPMSSVGTAIPDTGATESKLNPPFRIGLSGSPGVGKSTFIEAFGMHLIDRGHQVAVLVRLLFIRFNIIL
jgi:LAO/AO transport system kinase